jgi:hypothetical protein
MKSIISIIKQRGELTHATRADIESNYQKFWYRQGLDFLSLTRMKPADYPNFEHMKAEDKPKFILSCQNDWKWKTIMALEKLEQNNLFI